MICRDCGIDIPEEGRSLERCPDCERIREAAIGEIVKPEHATSKEVATPMEVRMRQAREKLGIEAARVAYSDGTSDPGYCGLDPLVTGPNDPFYQSGACPEHDADFDKLKAEKEYTPGSITKTALKWAWAVLGTPFYLIIGGIGGMIRGNQLARPKVKPDKPSGEGMI